MQKQLFTVHSISIKISYMNRPLLYGAAFLFFSFILNQANASLKIAVVDTGFCSQKIVTTSKHQNVKPALDMTGTNTYDCKKVSAGELSSGARFHGQNVLNEFLAYLPKTIPVTIQPLVVFDLKGHQSSAAWKKAITFIEKEKIDMVLTAAGFISKEILVKKLPSIWFVPSGRTERFITNKTVLFPQSLAPVANLFMIGSYFDEGQIIYDQALMYQDQIDYYFPSGKKSFSGSSRAVAHAMAKALQNCFVENTVMAAHSLRVCLLKSAKTLQDPILKKEFKTF